MSSAAIHGLYGKPGPSPKEYQKLSSHEIMKLAEVLSGYPPPGHSSKEHSEYVDRTQKLIKKLPSRLTSSSRLSAALHLAPPTSSMNKDGTVKKDGLCKELHADLKAKWVYSIWGFIRLAFEEKIGAFVHPLIENNILTAGQETRIRALEPVLEMWYPGYEAKENAAPRRTANRPMVQQRDDPMVYLPYWKRQENECPGCKLARIATDSLVVSALLSGFVAMYKTSRLEDGRSKRTTWCEAWLGQFANPKTVIQDAWEFGQELKRLRKAFSDHIQYKSWRELDERFVNRDPLPQELPRPHNDGDGSKKPQPRHSMYGIDLSEPFQPKEFAPMQTGADQHLETLAATTFGRSSCIPPPLNPTPKVQSPAPSKTPKPHSSSSSTAPSSWGSTSSTPYRYAESEEGSVYGEDGNDGSHETPPTSCSTPDINPRANNSSGFDHGYCHGYGLAPEDDNNNDGYDVSPPHSPTGRINPVQRNWAPSPVNPKDSNQPEGQTLAEMVRNGLRDDDDSSRYTRWSEMY